MRQRPKSEGGMLLSTPLRAPPILPYCFRYCLDRRHSTERLTPLATTVGGRGGCQRHTRGTFLRASLTDGAFQAAVWTGDFDYSANGSRNDDHRGRCAVHS